MVWLHSPRVLSQPPTSKPEIADFAGGLSLRGWWVVHEGWHCEGPRSSGVSAAARRRCGGRGTLQVGRRTTPSAPSHLAAAAAAAAAVSEHVHVVRLMLVGTP